MKRIGILLFLSGMFLACGQTGKRQVTSNGLVLEDILRQKATNSKEVLSWLKKCSTECRAPDNEIAKELSDGYQILFTISESNSVYSQLTEEQKKQAMVGQGKVRNAFVKILQTKSDRDILETAFRELVNPNSLYVSLDVDVLKALDSTIERLKKNSETLATAWYLKAISIPANVDTVLDVLAAYKSCIDASRSDMACQNGYKELIRFYERPRCRDSAFTKGTQFIGAFTKPDSAHGKKVLIYGKNYFLAKHPAMTAEDMLEATLENLGPDQYEIWFSVRTFSSNKLAKFTAEGLKKRSTLVLYINGKVLAEAPVLQKINDGQFRMPFANSGQAEEAFEKICQNITHDRIPDNLKISSNN